MFLLALYEPPQKNGTISFYYQVCVFFNIYLHLLQKLLSLVTYPPKFQNHPNPVY